MAIFIAGVLLERSRRLQAEATAVLDGAHADPPPERPAHRLDGPEARREGDRLDRYGTGLERDPGPLHARRLHVRGGCHPGLAAKGTREVALAHAGPARQGGNGQVLIQVVRDPLLELAQRLALGHLRGELGAELGLPARALEEQHEPAGRLERDLAT